MISACNNTIKELSNTKTEIDKMKEMEIKSFQLINMSDKALVFEEVIDIFNKSDIILHNFVLRGRYLSEKDKFEDILRRLRNKFVLGEAYSLEENIMVTYLQKISRIPRWLHYTGFTKLYASNLMNLEQ